MAHDVKFIQYLYDLIVERRDTLPKGSYVTKLFKKGRAKIAQKLGEEAVETVIEAMANDKERAVSESADLIFHLLVLWADMGLTPRDVIKELRRRHESAEGAPAEK
ncbi:MAG: phosphoribosyl-ATP diphosphatase [Rickettsiales bacterium]